MNRKKLAFAPRELFEKILEYSVIPTFDLVIELPRGGILIVRRIIAPYANSWALPGLRMMKPERIDDTIRRIALQEIGLKVDLDSRRFLGQFVGFFRTENNRQDLSTGYAVKADSDSVNINKNHFSGYRVIRHKSDVPPKTGAMYKYYIEQYFDHLL